MNLKYQNISQKQRSKTVSDEQSYSTALTRIKELEADLKQSKQENIRINNQLEELSAQILKNNIDNGRMLLHLTAVGNNNSVSFAAEIDTMSKDDVRQLFICFYHIKYVFNRHLLIQLMEKFKAEQQASQRLREYIDNILGRIMEYNPNLLEVCIGNSTSVSKSSVSSAPANTSRMAKTTRSDNYQMKKT